jgi:predicted transcriptional regulator
MTTREFANILEADVLWGEALLSKDIGGVCASDLMSDVLAFADSGGVLLTGLTNLQVVRTAEMADIAVICFVRGKRPVQEIVDLAKEKEIPLLATKYFMYEACGRLYKAGVASHSLRADS